MSIKTPEDNRFNNNPQFKLSPEETKKLISALQQQQLRGQGKIPQQQKQPRMYKVLVGFFGFIQKAINGVDRLINFIIKPSDPDRNVVLQKARGPILFGTYVIIFFVFFGGVWSAVAPLDKAAVAVGTVISSSNNKIIQHHGGGIINKVYVKQGDQVKEGQVLIELDDTQIKAKHDAVLNQYVGALATEARLTAELNKKDKVTFPLMLLDQANTPEIKKIILSQEELFTTRRNLLNNSIEQLNAKGRALQSRKIALEKRLEFIRKRITSTKVLLDKKFATTARLEELEENEVSVVSEISSIDIEMANNLQEINKYNNDYLNRALDELRRVHIELVSAREQYNSDLDMLNRTVIRAPVDGIINVLNYHSKGGVIGSGQPIAEISPLKDVLVVEAKVPQMYIDSVHVGLKAKMRFSAFKSRTSPVFTGKVVSLSPDIVEDRQSAMQFNQIYNSPMMGGDGRFYVARIEIDMDEFNKVAKARNLNLHPGMQAEVQIVTGSRTLLRYLLDPVTDNMFRSFKEK